MSDPVQVFHRPAGRGCEEWLHLRRDGLFHYHWHGPACWRGRRPLVEYSMTPEAAIEKFPEDEPAIRRALAQEVA
ncbi:MAG TPA: hypothetical protein VFV58_39335 [Blastocatellia bacterium]|nr:hypothetical protein [Blastocatellia bacterium]